MPNLEHLAAMGWGVWPQPDNPPVAEDVPELIPMNANVGAEFAGHPDLAPPVLEQKAEPVEEVVQVVGLPVQGPAEFAPAPEHILEMDDVTDQSEEPQMPPLIDDLEVEMPVFPNSKIYSL